MNCFALTIVAEKQKRVAVGDRKSHSPQENHWSVLRTAKRKIAQVGDNSEKSHILEPRLGFEPRTPSLPWKCSTTELSRQNTCPIVAKSTSVAKNNTKATQTEPLMHICRLECLCEDPDGNPDRDEEQS